MRIKTQFIITMLIFGVILVIIAASAIVTSRQAEKTGVQEEIASSIAQGANELSYLANDYLIYRESQQLKRWQSRFASFSNQVARLNVDKPEHQVLVRNIQANQRRLKEVFDSVASVPGTPSRDQGTPFDPTLLQVSWSRMAVQSQALVSDASGLSQLLDKQVDQLRETRTMLMYVMVGLFGLFLLASYMLTYRRILKSIVVLQARTAVIGSGNLDLVIEEKRNDEIGDLSRAFNKMTTNLKAVTASKSDLEREVTRRKQAEEDLRRQREWLSVTLSSIGDAVIASDTSDRITFLNPVAVTLTGWQSEEALGESIRDVFRIINEKTHAPAEDLVARVLNEKRMVALANDTALVTKDGREVPIEDSAAPILDASGNITGVVLVFHDVTQKRRAQAALLEAHERATWLARFPDENPNPVLRASADGSVLYCNRASVELHGWVCKVGQPLPDPLSLLVRQAMAEGKEVQQDVELGGRFYFVAVTPFPGEGYANVYGRDITERRRAEEKISRQNKIQEATNQVFQKALTCDTEQELGRMCLTVAEELTGSKFGFIDEIGEDGNLHDIAISDPGWELCTMYDKTGHRTVAGGFKIHGLYGRVAQDGKSLLTNDPPSHPDSIGVPEGHPPLTAFLGVPFLHGGKTIGVVAVGNREGGYTEEQQQDLEAVAPTILQSLLRKRAEVALRESEQRLNRAQEIGRLGSWELDLVNNRLTWSDEVYRIFGLQPQEFGATYEVFLEAVHPDDRAAVDAAYSGSVREGRDTYEIEHRVVRKSTGEIRIVHERCEHIRDASGRIIRSIGMVHDITERKRAEEATLRAKEEWEQTFDTVPDLVAILDDQHRIVRVNRAMADRLGLAPEQCIGLHCYEAVHETMEPPGFCPHALTCQDGKQHIAEVHEPRLGGDFLVSTTPLCNPQGQIIGAVHVARDITTRKMAEEVLEQRTFELQQLTKTLEQRVQERTEELEETNKALRQLSIRLLSAQEEERKRIAGEIHDSLGACLAAIKFKVEDVLQEIEKTAKVPAQSLSTIVPVIQDAVEECRRIQMDLRPSILDDLGLLPTLSWFCRRFQTIFSGIRIEQEIDIEESDMPPSVKIVAFRITQEALNNIAKHSHANLVRLSLQKIDDRMELTLQDNGRGFDLGKTVTIESTKRGMGLSSMRERTELSGGSFAIESGVGKGTIIRASWPI